MMRKVRLKVINEKSTKPIGFLFEYLLFKRTEQTHNEKPEDRNNENMFL